MQIVWYNSYLEYETYSASDNSLFLQRLFVVSSYTQLVSLIYGQIHCYTLRLGTLCDKGHVFTELLAK